MNRRPRLLVIDPSIVWPEDAGVAEVIGDWPGEARVLRPALHPGDGPGPGDGYNADGIVLLGSRASAHDDLPWLRELGAWLDPIFRGERPIPLLAICFGHQLLAHRAGGSVGLVHPDGKAELGVRETAVHGSRLLPGVGRMRVVASHKEEVKRVPAGFKVICHRPDVEADGLEHERLPIFSFQFHPEAREEFLVRRHVDPAGLDARAIEDNRHLLAAFRDLVRERAVRKDP